MSTSASHRLSHYPWYFSDFNTSTRGWPLVARACYRELLDVQFDQGTLPADPEALRVLAGATRPEWKRAWPLLEPKLPLNCSGRRNPRLEEHRSRVIAAYESRRASAEAATRSRLEKRR